MKKMILIAFIFIQSTAFAEISRPPALALEWWLREQGKFESAHVCTAQEKSGSFVITKWEVSGVKEPSDNQIESIIDDYESYLIQKSNSDSLDRKSILTKIGLTENELEILKKDSEK